MGLIYYAASEISLIMRFKDSHPWLCATSRILLVTRQGQIAVEDFLKSYIRTELRNRESMRHRVIEI